MLSHFLCYHHYKILYKGNKKYTIYGYHKSGLMWRVADWKNGKSYNTDVQYYFDIPNCYTKLGEFR